MSLLTAVKSGDETLVETICASGASPNELDDGASPMHIVVGLHSKNAKQLAMILLQYGGDPNAENEEYLTPIHVSVIRGNSKILHLLLRNGGDPSKVDEEGRDAWDYALKYGRNECQKILLDYMDEDTLAGSDEEQQKYVSIFHKDVPVRDEGNLSELSSTSSLLNKGFVRSSTTSPDSDQQIISPDSNLSVIQEDRDVVDFDKETPPRPPPRRSKSVKTGEKGGCSCSSHMIPPADLRSGLECAQSKQETGTSAGTSAAAKPRRTLLSAIRKTLSPSAKPDIRDQVDSPNSKSSSPSTSYSSSSSKSKSRSPLALLLRSPTKSSKFSRKSSCIEPNTVRFESKLLRAYSVPSQARLSSRSRSERDRELVNSTPVAIEATSDDNCEYTLARSGSPRKRLNMEVVGRGDQLYSPSNYCSTVGKPDKEKKLESPFRLKTSRKKNSSKNLFKRLLGSTPSSPDDNNPGCITIGMGQTVTLSDRNPRDSVSILSLVGTDQQNLSGGGCSYCNSSSSIEASKSSTEASNSRTSTVSFKGSIEPSKISSIEAPRIIDSKEMAAIEAGRKVFDATSPDHCMVVEVNTSTTDSLDATAPLDTTICYQSPPPKPLRLFLTSEFSVHHPTDSPISSHSQDVVDSKRRTPPPIVRSSSDSNSQANRESHGIHRTQSDVGLGASTSRDDESPYPTVRLPKPFKGQSQSTEIQQEISKVIDSSSTAKPSAIRRIGTSPAALNAGDLRGSLTMELEQAFKAIKLKIASEEEPQMESQAIPEVPKPKRMPRRKDSRPGHVVNAEIRESSELDSCSRMKPPSSSNHKPVRPNVKGVNATNLNHRWSSNGRKKSKPLVRQQSVEVDDRTANEYPTATTGVSLSKDSGIESNPAVNGRGQRRTSCSEDSFHTCQSGSLARPSSCSVSSEIIVSSLTQLPTETDSLQAKVSRMNLEDFSMIASDDSEDDMADGGDYSQCVTIRPSSICASDGSIAEYLHTDLGSNVTLTEARWPITCVETSNSMRSIDWKTFSELSMCSDTSNTSIALVTVPREILYLSDKALLKELVELGDVPGPINAATKRVYQLRLTKLRENPQLCTPNKSCGFSRELQQFMKSHSSVKLAEISQWEHELVKQFETNSGRKWREGNCKMSFTYLLLDPRTTKNLPARHLLLDAEENGEAFRVFLSAIFYIGKGKKTRPFQHFIDAIKKKNDSTKTQQIIDIWKSGLGVVSLHLFHNILPVEAYTREACMVDAIDLKNLTNIAKCNYYGVATTWSTRKKRLVGSELLRKAYSIILLEGERQIRPADVRDDSELPSFLV